MLAIVLHTTGLIFDMMLTGRPPVTNRYSLIIFAGWTLALLALAVERWVARNGAGLALAAAVALTALVTAYGLAPGGAVSLMRNVFDIPFTLAIVAMVVTLRVGGRGKGGSIRRAAMAAA
jgi:ABC-type transport system involved in cytochrome c biogenesis permease subunit